MVYLGDNGWLYVVLTIVSMNGQDFLILYSILVCIMLWSSLEPFSPLFLRKSEEVKILSHEYSARLAGRAPRFDCRHRERSRDDSKLASIVGGGRSRVFTDRCDWNGFWFRNGQGRRCDIESMANSHYGMKGLRTKTTVILFGGVK